MAWKELGIGRSMMIGIRVFLFSLLIIGLISCTCPEEQINGFTVVERTYSDDPNNLSIGLANLHAIVPGIEANKEKILEAIDTFKEYEVNMVIFPEFCISGYFWDDYAACWAYEEKGVIENQLDWLLEVESKLDDDLQYIIFNGL